MARRLLGADNAATVFSTQQTEEEPVTQVHTLNNIVSLQCLLHGMSPFDVLILPQSQIWDHECLACFLTEGTMRSH